MAPNYADKRTSDVLQTETQTVTELHIITYMMRDPIWTTHTHTHTPQPHIPHL